MLNGFLLPISLQSLVSVYALYIQYQTDLKLFFEINLQKDLISICLGKSITLNKIETATDTQTLVALFIS